MFSIMNQLDKKRFERTLLMWGIKKPWVYPFVIGLLTFLIGVGCSVLKWPKFWVLKQYGLADIEYLVLSFLVGLLSYFLTNWLNRFIITYACLPEILYDVVHLAPSKWIGGNHEDKSLEKIYKDLVDLEDKRAVAFKFAIESLQQIVTTGFIMFENDVSKYVDYLIDGIESSKDCIFATCLVRPYWFVVNTTEEKTSGGMRKEVGGYKVRSKHLIPFRDVSKQTDKYRLMLLKIDDVKVLIQDILLNIEFASSEGKNSANTYWELPEIQWFIEDLNSPPSVKIYWAVEEEDWFRKTDDFMLVDQQIAMRFKFVSESLGIGHLFLRWGSNLHSDSIEQNVTKFLEIVKPKENHQQHSPKDWSAHNVEQETDAFIYRSIKKLVTKSDLELDAFKLEHDDVKEYKSEEEVQNINTFIENFETVADLYNGILQGLNDGSLRYPASVKVRLRNKKGELVAQDVDWQNNWKNVKKSNIM